RRQRQNTHAHPGISMQQARKHVAVATVVAGAGNDQDVPRLRPVRPQASPQRLPGARHQFRPRHAAFRQHGFQRLGVGDGMQHPAHDSIVEPPRPRSARCVEGRLCGRGPAPTMPGMQAPATADDADRDALKRNIVQWGRDLGFQAVGITHIDLREDESALAQWLALGRHGDMDYMARHGEKRSRPEALVPGTISVISVRMDYLPADAAAMGPTLDDPDTSYYSRLACGRAYNMNLLKRQ